MSPKVKKSIGNMCIPILRVFIFIYYCATMIRHRASVDGPTDITVKDCWLSSRLTAIFTVFPEEEKSINAAMDKFIAAVHYVDDHAAQFNTQLTKLCHSDKFVVESKLVMSLLSEHHRTLIAMTLLSDMAEKLFQKNLSDRGSLTGNLRIDLLNCAVDVPMCKHAFHHERAVATSYAFINAVESVSPKLLDTLIRYPELSQRLIVKARNFYFTPEEVWEMVEGRAKNLDVGDTVLFANIEDKVIADIGTNRRVIKLTETRKVECRLVDRDGVIYATLECYWHQ